MSNNLMFNRLLPKNSTLLEKNIDDISIRINDLPVQFWQLNNVDRCPPPFLPWLAWARRVEYWDSSWTVGKQRDVIKEARRFNAERGTKSTLTQAMDYLGISHTLTPWHELTPKGQPHTFTVKITSGRISVQTQQEIYTALNSVKSARDLFSIDATVVNVAQFTVAGACRTGSIVHLATRDI